MMQTGQDDVPHRSGNASYDDLAQHCLYKHPHPRTTYRSGIGQDGADPDHAPSDALCRPGKGGFGALLHGTLLENETSHLPCRVFVYICVYVYPIFYWVYFLASRHKRRFSFSRDLRNRWRGGLRSATYMTRTRVLTILVPCTSNPCGCSAPRFAYHGLTASGRACRSRATEDMGGRRVQGHPRASSSTASGLPICLGHEY